MSCSFEHASDAADHGGWFIPDLLPGDPGGAVTGGDEDLVAPAVTLERPWRAVRLFAIGLNCEPLLFPEHVHWKNASFTMEPAMPIDTEPYVGSRGRKTFFNKPWQESRLEPTADYRVWFCRVSPGSQDRAQARGSPPAPTRKDAIDLIDVENSQDRCLLDEASH